MRIRCRGNPFTEQLLSDNPGIVYGPLPSNACSFSRSLHSKDLHASVSSSSIKAGCFLNQLIICRLLKWPLHGAFWVYEHTLCLCLFGFYDVVLYVLNDTWQDTELLGFRTLSIVRILIITRKKNKHDVSETGFVSVLRWGDTPILLGPLERANLNHWTTYPRTLSSINTWDQLESMRSNKKKCNKNFSKARTCVELG
jgi:hypothetical protein